MLKVSYIHFGPLNIPNTRSASLIRYISTGQNRPKTKFVRLYVELIRGHKLTEAERPACGSTIPTNWIRCHVQILVSGRVANRICPLSDCPLSVTFKSTPIALRYLFSRIKPKPPTQIAYPDFQNAIPIRRIREPELSKIEMGVFRRGTSLMY